MKRAVAMSPTWCSSSAIVPRVSGSGLRPTSESTMNWKLLSAKRSHCSDVWTESRARSNNMFAFSLDA